LIGFRRCLLGCGARLAHVLAALSYSARQVIG
jgi:hypothetical protein